MKLSGFFQWLGSFNFVSEIINQKNDSTMLKTIKTFLMLLIAVSLYAQVPETLNYQAVARNNAGVALANQTIKVRMTLLRNNVSLYTETRQVTTNLLGLFNVQIGGPGAISTSGDMSAISWLGNTPNAILLKVEIDLNNTNVFTDMGTQPFNTVPFAFSSKTAIEVINLAGRYIDQTTTPAINSRLVWDGYAWTPIKKDSTINLGGSIDPIPAGGPSAPWVWVGNSTPFATYTTLTVSGTETISANIVGSFGHTSNSYVTVNISVCYQGLPGGAITSFNPDEIETFIPANTSAPRTLLSAAGSKKLPAGTFKVGMCIKNKSTSAVTLGNNDKLNGIIEVKY